MPEPERWAETMQRLICALFLLLCLAGCVQRPPSPVNGKLSKKQLAWYERRALSWFEEQREARRRGRIEGPLILGIEPDYDRSTPVKSQLSTDQSAVTVSLPKKVTKFREEWFLIDVDTHSGMIKRTAREFVNNDFF